MKKILSLFTAFAMTAVLLTGCSPSNQSASTAAPESSAEVSETAGPGEAETEAVSESTAEPVSENAIRIGSLKGPTSIGLVSLMNTDTSANEYSFNMVTAADELVASVAAGRIDIALVPANVASVLYHKTQGGISVIDINTLGVLYVVSADDSIQSFSDLKGKTVYLTGKGTTPDYVTQYLIKASGLSESDVTLEYKSEPTEVAVLLGEEEGAIGILPQPFATVAIAQNDSLQTRIDMTKEWETTGNGENGQLVTGVTIVRNEFLNDHEEEVAVFLSDHKTSVDAVTQAPDVTAEQIVQAGIIENAAIAQRALPYCNVTYIDGETMQQVLSGYLNVLFEQDPASIGGSLPDDNFYYIGN